MKIEINPNRISDGDEAWEDGWNAACAYRNGNLEKSTAVLREIAEAHPTMSWQYLATHRSRLAREFLEANGLLASDTEQPKEPE